MGKLQGYNRKNYLRHRTTKQQRMTNKGIDMAFKGAGAVGKSVMKASKTKTVRSSKYESASVEKSLTPEKKVRLPRLLLVAGFVIGFLAFFIASASSGLGTSLFCGIVAFWISISIFRTIYGTIKGFKEGYEIEETDSQGVKAVYQPNPEWMGQMGLVDSRANAQILAPQFMKQALESAKILQTTTEPGTFFTRYDFCVGRLMELEECKKYGVSVSTTQDLEKYRNMDFREEAVEEIIHRTQEKYRDKIESLKTQKAKQNWATKYHQAFEPYLPYMSDAAKSKLGESSAELFALAEKKDDTAESVR